MMGALKLIGALVLTGIGVMALKKKLKPEEKDLDVIILEEYAKYLSSSDREDTTQLYEMFEMAYNVNLHEKFDALVNYYHLGIDLVKDINDPIVDKLLNEYWEKFPSGTTEPTKTETVSETDVKEVETTSETTETKVKVTTETIGTQSPVCDLEETETISETSTETTETSTETVSETTETTSEITTDSEDVIPELKPDKICSRCGTELYVSDTKTWCEHVELNEKTQKLRYIKKPKKEK